MHKVKHFVYGAAMTGVFILALAAVVRNFLPSFSSWFSFSKGA